MVNTVEKIRQLVKSIHSRDNNIDYIILERVEEWLSYNEIGLAIDEIVDSVVESDIPITPQELKDIIKIYEILKCEMRVDKEYLSKLVVE
jgi:tryptophan 2,3-dioxygenase